MPVVIDNLLNPSEPATLTISDTLGQLKNYNSSGQFANVTEAKLARLVLSFERVLGDLQQLTALFEQEKVFSYLYTLLGCMIKKKPANTTLYMLAAKLWLHQAGYGSTSNAAFEQALHEYILINK
jgi:hypothetical protein